MQSTKRFPVMDMDDHPMADEVAGYDSGSVIKESRSKADQLWQAYEKDRSNDNRNELLMHYIDLVKRVVNRLIASSNPYHEYDDLISCGVIGLMDALDRFDTSRGARFESYAQIRIKGEIIDYMRRQDWLPVNQRTKLRQMQAGYETLAQKLGREPTDQEVADHLDTDVQQLRQMMGEAHLANLMSFDDLMADSSSRRHVEAVDTAIEQAHEEEEMRQLLISELQGLSEREQMILSLYYMDELTLKEIGVVLGLTESRISQIHSKALMRLKARLMKKI